MTRPAHIRDCRRENLCKSNLLGLEREPRRWEQNLVNMRTMCKSYRAFQSHGDTFQDHARRGDASYKDNRTVHKRGKHTNGTALPYSPRAYTNMDARGRTGRQHT